MPPQEQAVVPRETPEPMALVPLGLEPVCLAPGILIAPLIKLQGDLEPYDANAENIEGQVSRAEISSLDQYQGGSDILTAIQAQLTQIEKLRVDTKKPADDYGKMVQKLVTPILGRLQEAKNTLQLKMLKWRNEEEARQRAAQDAIRKQQEEEARKLADAARAKGNEKAAEKIEEMVAAAPTAPAPKISVPNYAGKTHGKRVYWLGDVQDPMEICRRVVSGELPIHVVEFSKSGMNAVATKLMESIPEAERTERLHLGIKITKSEKLV
jgi:hypothetical protein